MFADSRDVASAFEKQHGHVLRDIDNLILKDPDHGRRGFTEATYRGVQPFGSSSQHNYIAPDYRCFHMTRDGFALLAMGFTGERALKFKRAYIRAIRRVS